MNEDEPNGLLSELVYYVFMRVLAMHPVHSESCSIIPRIRTGTSYTSFCSSQYLSLLLLAADVADTSTELVKYGYVPSCPVSKGSICLQSNSCVHFGLVLCDSHRPADFLG